MTPGRPAEGEPAHEPRTTTTRWTIRRASTASRSCQVLADALLASTLRIVDEVDDHHVAGWTDEPPRR
jgi:hypothetical protein